jgi:single-strand DNA-binding protein
MSLNRVSLLGHVGKAPQFYETAEGEAYARFSLATQESWKDAQGQKQTRTQWHSVVVFSQGLVEIARKHMNKGAYVFLEGMLHHRKVLTDDGREYPVTEVLLKDYQSLLRILNRGKEASAVSCRQEEDADQPGESR